MHCPRRGTLAREDGLTLTEIMIAVVMVTILVGATGPRIAPVLTRTAAGQAASLVAVDLEQAVSLASRQRRPVRIACDCAAGRYTFTDRANGTVLFTRAMTGTAGGFGLTGLAFTNNPVDVFPSGQTSAPLTVSLTANNVTRQVAMSTGGFVRVITP